MNDNYRSKTLSLYIEFTSSKNDSDSSTGSKYRGGSRGVQGVS
jgi:hypothetical protein